MWIPLVAELQPGLRVFAPRYPTEHPHEWYLQAGAAASVKAVTLCCLLFNITGARVRLTTDSRLWSSRFTLGFEGFICGPHRDGASEGENQNYLDAFAVALAGWQCYCEHPGPPVVHHHHAGDAVRQPAAWLDESQWPGYFDWLRVRLELFTKAFRPRIDRL
jgi:hypothetical protein